jgi:hypothetical protein
LLEKTGFYGSGHSAQSIILTFQSFSPEIFAQPVGQTESAQVDFFGHCPPAPPKSLHEGEWLVESVQRTMGKGQ